ncbi:MAG: hypothetical protein ABIS92_18585 [Polyangia bacterium]
MTVPSAAIVAAIRAPALSLRQQIGDVVVLADLAGIRRGIFAVKHTDQAEVVHAILDRVQCLEEPFQSITRDAHRGRDLFAGRRPGGLFNRIHHRRGNFGGNGAVALRRISGCCRINRIVAGFGFAGLGFAGRRFGARSCLGAVVL